MHTPPPPPPPHTHTYRGGEWYKQPCWMGIKIIILHTTLQKQDSSSVKPRLWTAQSRICGSVLCNKLKENKHKKNRHWNHCCQSQICLSPVCVVDVLCVCVLGGGGGGGNCKGKEWTNNSSLFECFTVMHQTLGDLAMLATNLFRLQTWKTF